MANLLQDKVALVTGGTSGIGEATALLFAREGASVVVSGRREKEGSEIVGRIEAAGGKAKFVLCDVSQEDQVRGLIDQTMKTFGRLDIAFNNAGLEQSPLASLTETTTEDYRRVFDVNVFGVWACMKYEIPVMKRGATIVNTTSVAGHLGMPGASTYVAAKHAVEGLTKSVALEVAEQGIRINAVAPAAIETEMLSRFAGGLDGELSNQLRAMHPVGRMGRPDEIAQAVLYLVSPFASFTTGISLPVDGGFMAR